MAGERIKIKNLDPAAAALLTHLFPAHNPASGDTEKVSLQQIYDLLSTLIVPSGGGVPIGTIVLWFGSIATIPSGWALCDGGNGTPDLMDKFVVGAREDVAGEARTMLTGALTKTGGSIQHGHGVDDPGHSHSLTNYTTNIGLNISNALDQFEPFTTTNALGYGFNVAQQATFDNVPTNDSGTAIGVEDASAPQPYYALAYIMRTA